MSQGQILLYAVLPYAAVAVFGDQLKLLAAGEADFDKLMAEVVAFNQKHAGRLPAISDRR